METTARLLIPYPDLTGADTPVNLPQVWYDRAVILDKLAPIDEGPLSNRPVSTPGSPGIVGRFYITNDQLDSPRLDLDIGAAWVTVGPAQIDAAANVASLRTLGQGALQAMAGNDARVVGAAPLASPAFTGTPTAPTQASGDVSGALATDSFVATAVANAVAGNDPAVAVDWATTAALPASTYANGNAGVGATLTANANGTYAPDGVTTIAANQRVLVKNQGAQPQNGLYVVSQPGSAGSPFVLTRASDFNAPANMNKTGAIPVINGVANGQTQWVMTATVNIVGTDAVVFTEFGVAPVAQELKANKNIANGYMGLDANSRGMDAIGVFDPDLRQPGVLNSGDSLLTNLSIDGPGDATVSVQAGTAFIPLTAIAGSQLQRISAPAQNNVVFAPLPNLPINGSSRTYTLYLNRDGTLGVLAGVTAVGNLSVVNNALLPYSPAPAGSLAIANFSVYNNAGVFQLSFQTGLAQGINWIDRRPWAKGAFYSDTFTATFAQANIWAYIEPNGVRLECGGVPLEIELTGLAFRMSAAPVYGVHMGVSIDGNAPAFDQQYFIETASQESVAVWTPAYKFVVAPTPGSHLFRFQQKIDAGAVILDQNAGIRTYREQVRPNFKNGSA